MPVSSLFPFISDMIIPYTISVNPLSALHVGEKRIYFSSAYDLPPPFVMSPLSDSIFEQPLHAPNKYELFVFEESEEP